MARNFKTTEQYIQDLVNRNATFYPVEEYVRSSQPILHECFNGHQWNLRPNDALKGSNCPQCQRQSKTIVNVYHVSFVYEGKTYYKIGISSTPLARRFRTKWKELQMQEIWQVERPNRYLAKALEQELLGLNIDHLINLDVLQERGGDSETLSVKVEKPVN